MNSPWQSWPLWKQVLLVLVLAAVVFALFKVAKELWEAGERVLAAFAALLGVFVRTLPQVVIAGLIAHGRPMADQQLQPVIHPHSDRVQLAVELRNR